MAKSLHRPGPWASASWGVSFWYSPFGKGLSLMVLRCGGCVLFATVALAAASQDRTTKALGSLSEEDRYHSTLFLGMGHPGSRPLDTLGSVAMLVDMVSTTGSAPTWTEFIRDRTCSSSAVFIGDVKSQQVHPTADGQFLFTVLTVELSSVLRRTEPAGSAPERTATVVKAGGTVVADRTTVSANYGPHPDLVNGAKYAFFVDFLPRTSAYVLRDTNAVFTVRGNAVVPFASLYFPDGDPGVTVVDLGRIVRAVRCG